MRSPFARRQIAEEAQLADARVEVLEQQMTACPVTASRCDRKAKAAPLVPARDRAMLQHDECDRATGPHGAAIRLARRSGGSQSFALQAVHEDRSQTVCLLKRGRDAREARRACSEPPHSELLKGANDTALLDGRHVIREIELRRPQPSSH